MTDHKPAVVVTANIKGWLPMLQWRVRRALVFVLALRVTELELPPDLIGWQECWWPRYRRAIRKLGGFGHNCPSSSPGSGGTCTSYRSTRFSFVAAGRVQLHPALTRIAGSRTLTWTSLVDRLNGRSITHASAHLIPGAFNRRSLMRSRRLELWVRGVAELRDWIEGEVRAGQLVIVSIDANAPRDQLVHELGTHIAGEPVRVQSHAPDHVIVVGRGLEVLDVADAHEGTTSDHDPVTVVLVW